MSDATQTQTQTPPPPPPLMTADYPEYWLGQLATISDMEHNGALTRAQMISEVHRVVKAMRSHDRDKRFRALQR